ncbi:hypothetical protein [Luteolibacter luteus]|uniref:Uncharacterized protein n=1 Tax=Luteolibacter luteus TaxID=2728835 RepID=A0A858RC15_9BACT|nr:hypothetical protein [Luteolibacter luteus]QJE94225.1 hypothetical protein HHL09_10405 [Luteolibacter luteus]
MKTLTLLLHAAFLCWASIASAALRINEVHANPPGTDVQGTDGYEYIEIISTTGGVESTDTFFLLLLDTDGGNMGRVDGVWNLNGMATGTNGILLLGLNYASTGGGPWAGRIAPGTALGNLAIPPGKDGLIEPNRAWTILLVKGFGGTVGVTDVSADDVNLNAGIRSNLHDAVGLNENLIAGSDDETPFRQIADLSQSTYSPGNVSRIAGNITANAKTAWFGGETTGANSLSVSLDPLKRFGSQINPVATPGAPNIPPVPAEIRINEVAVNPPGSDGNYEFVELLKIGGDATTGLGYHLLVINTDNSSDTTCFTDRSLGVIVEAWDLSAVEFGSNGLALIGEDYDEGLSPWRDHVDPATVLSDIGSSADPDEIKLGTNDIGNQIYIREGGVCTTDRTNNGFTLLLVKDFTGSALQDLDTNNDGTLDATPWSSIVDSVGYAGATPTYAVADLSQPGYQPDNLSRKAGNTTANSAAAFYGGHHSGDNPFHIGFGSGFFGGFRGHATPGRPNLSTAPAPAPLVVNEVNFAPPGNAAEFIELKSTGDRIAAAQGYSMLLVSTASEDRGEVLKTYDLADYSTGPNGLLLMGELFESQANTIFPTGAVRADTAVESGPPGFVGGDLPDQDFALLLVTGFSGSVGMDLDANNDGTIDAGLGFTIADGIAFGPLSHPSITGFPASLAADNISRSGNDPHGWYGGTIAGSNAGSLTYDSSFGPWIGTVTPGQGNHSAAPSSSLVVINEANVNPPGADLNYDYVELLSTGIKEQSLNDLTLIAIDTSAGEDGLGNVGEISRIWALDSLATGRNGLILMGDGYATSPEGGPFASVKSPLTSTGDPVGMNVDMLSSNDGLALLLVRGFSGRLGQDLDTANDGVLDLSPWTEIVDSIVFGDVAFGLPDLSQGSYRPDNLSRGGRFADLVASDSSKWYGGTIAGTSGDSVAFDPSKSFDFTAAVGTGSATPGRLNLGGVLDDEVDNDLDGHANLLELAFATDPDSADRTKFPKNLALEIGGQTYLGLSFSRPKGGSGSALDYTAGNIRYVVEVSDNLGAWVPAGASVLQVSASDDGNGVSETIVVRLADPSSPSGTKRFLRLRAERL